MMEKRVIIVVLPFGLIIDVARLVVVVVVDWFGRVKFSGWPIYRENAAQISVKLRANLELNAQNVYN